MNIDVIKIAQQVIDTEIKGLHSIKGVINQEFVKLMELVLSIKGRLIMCGIGKSGHVAKKISASLSSTGTPSFFIQASEAAHGDLGMITENDAVMVLSNSGESAELNNIINYCHRFSIPVIGMSRVANSTLISHSTIKIILPEVDEASSVNAPTTSTIMMMAFGDAMMVALHEKKGFTKNDFVVFHPGGTIGSKLLRIRDLMHSGEEIPVVVDTAFMKDAVFEIAKKRFGCVAIVDESGKLSGIFTDGDLNRSIHKDLAKTPIVEVMTKTPKVISPDMLAVDGLALMNSKFITNLFVVENGIPIGIIHMHDLLKAKIA